MQSTAYLFTKAVTKTVITKSFLVSKTIWVNMVALGLALANHYLGSTGPIPAVDPQVVAIVIATLNLVLRFKTSEPVSLALPVAR